MCPVYLYCQEISLGLASFLLMCPLIKINSYTILGIFYINDNYRCFSLPRSDRLHVRSSFHNYIEFSSSYSLISLIICTFDNNIDLLHIKASQNRINLMTFPYCHLMAYMV